MIHHIVVSVEAAFSLRQASQDEESLKGRVWVLKDNLSVGPLERGEFEGFTARRQQYWSTIKGTETEPIEDMERILELSAILFRNPEDEAWFWLSQAADDLASYLWSLPYLVKHLGRYRVLAYAKLPFLREDGKLFYPRHIGEISVAELVKARKLAIPLTASEAEFDLDHWNQILTQGTGARTTTGGKKLKSIEEDHFDPSIWTSLPKKWTRASRWLPTLLSSYQIPLPIPFLIWRLKLGAAQGKVAWRGDWDKELKDWEVCQPSIAHDNHGNHDNEVSDKAKENPL